MIAQQDNPADVFQPPLIFELWRKNEYTRRL